MKQKKATKNLTRNSQILKGGTACSGYTEKPLLLQKIFLEAKGAFFNSEETSDIRIAIRGGSHLYQAIFVNEYTQKNG